MTNKKKRSDLLSNMFIAIEDWMSIIRSKSFLPPFRMKATKP
jgi:hypothetical protein